MELKRSNPLYGLKISKKLIRQMKLSAILSFAIGFSSFANSYSQVEISLSVENQSIINVLDQIESDTDLRFMFGSDIYDFQKVISVDFDKAKLNNVIALIFESKLIYDLKENVVVLKKSPVKSANNILVKDEIIVLDTNIQEDIVQNVIEGNVTDGGGNPLPGATVIELGTSNGTTTDFDGNFSLAVDGENPTLLFAYLGFISQNIVAENDSKLNVALLADIAGLDEVILTGYGSQNKRDITSSISVLDLDGVAEKANTDVGQLLQSRSAGVRVVQNNGAPGRSAQIFIRGISSLSGNTQPLYVIDGVVSYSTAAIDPNNIEDITVLKDASAAGIYGAAGASNGVVLITTKKGRTGEFKASVNTYVGFSELIRKIPLLGSSDLADYFQDINISLTGDDLSIYNDWQDLTYRQASQTGINASISGGGENGSFFVGLGYLDQEGIVLTSKNKRYSLSINLDQKINDWLSFGTHLNYTRANVRVVPDDRGARFGGAISSALQTPPFQAIFDENGFYTVAAKNNTGMENPLSYIYGNDNNDVITNMVADTNFSIKLPYNLTFKTQLGVILSGNRYSAFRDPTLVLPAKDVNGQLQYNTGESDRFIFDNTLSYNEIFGNHKLNVVLGSSTSEENLLTSFQRKNNIASASIRTLNTASESNLNETTKGSWSLQSYFARANYTYDDKYSVTASVRTDGSSRIAADNRWASFKTFSAGWNLSNESFMQDIDVVKNLKLRAGYGETGNLPRGLNPYANIIIVDEVAGGPSALIPGRRPSSQAGNSDLQWETSEQVNIGLDFSILNDRIYVTTDYYTKKTKNMIFPLPLPTSTGFENKIVNLDGYIENKGFEFAVNASLINKGDFSWNTSYNMSFNNNVVKDIPDNASLRSTLLQNSGGNLTITKNGLPLASFWGYNSEGVDPATGDLIFTENDGVAGITPSDKQVIGNPMPDFTYGFINEFSYKNWDLNVVIDGVSGNDIYNSAKQNLQAMRLPENQSADIIRRWRNPGDITDIPRATSTDSNGNSDINSRWVEDGSYLRVRDISLSYNFDQDVLDAVNISGLRLYANLKNWLTITDYSGYSPEVNKNAKGTDAVTGTVINDPVALTQGVDYGSYPQAKTFSIGLNIEF